MKPINLHINLSSKISTVIDLHLDSLMYELDYQLRKDIDDAIWEKMIGKITTQLYSNMTKQMRRDLNEANKLT